MSPRRKSVDSSESSGSGSEYGGHKKHKDKNDKKDKKDKDKKEKKDKDKKDKDHKLKPGHGDISYGGSSHIPAAAPAFAPPTVAPAFAPPTTAYPPPMSYDNYGGQHQQQAFGGQHDSRSGGFPSPPHHEGHGGFAPPAHGGHSPHPAPPPSGYRLPLTTQGAFPDATQRGPAPFTDLDGSPVFIGSALFERSVQPCKIGPHLNPYASVPYGGGEHAHHGRFDLLPYDPNQMEWVPTSYGRIPQGRRPIEGGYEEGGEKLYHAAAIVNGVMVPGKAGEHLNGARVAFGGVEHGFDSSYEILCWR